MTRRTLAAATAAAALLCAAGLAAQTPDSVCALDSLRLVSPDQIQVNLSDTGRFGTVVSWPDLNDAISTCSVVTDTAGIGFPVALDGDYKDIYDREILFSCIYGGDVGSRVANSVLFTWANVNQAVTGRVIGEINLSDNGGVFAMDDTGAWSQTNNGLPMFTTKTDVIGLCESPLDPGELLASIRGRVSRGLWLKPDVDSDWRRIATETFPDRSLDDGGPTAIAFSPSDPQTFVVGTTKRGLYVTHDGGETFTQRQNEFDSGGTWSQRRVTAVSWATDQSLLVAVSTLGLYRSSDGGDTFQLFDTFKVPVNFPVGGGLKSPVVNAIVDLGTSILAGVDRFGVYETSDDGGTWQWRWDDLLSPGAVPITVTTLAVDPDSPQVLMAGTAAAGLHWTPNNGNVWYTLGANIDWPEGTRPRINSLVLDQSAGRYVAAADRFSLLVCDRGDTNWSAAGITQPGIRTLNRVLVSGTAGVRYWLASYDGGVYVPGSSLRLTDTIKKSQTDPAFQNLDFGLSITFGAGAVADSSRFNIIAQDYQGFAVWRGELADYSDMELIGLYDKNNPETCIEGYCGDTSYNVIPSCYVDKRAACFDFSTPGTVSFFDDSVFEGFNYYYSVTTFDYGNTALVSPSILTADQLFSTRYPNDPNSIFGGMGNVEPYFLAPAYNDSVAAAEGIYVFPNPLRLNSGFSGAEGEMVTFKNLPPGSRVRVFTVDGDLVADLGPDQQQQNLMPWITRNASGHLLASGVYIYKVEMPERSDFYGKVVIIR